MEATDASASSSAESKYVEGGGGEGGGGEGGVVAPSNPMASGVAPPGEVLALFLYVHILYI